jgi:hypothetical protein
MDSQCLVCQKAGAFINETMQQWSVPRKSPVRKMRKDHNLGVWSAYQKRVNCIACQEVFRCVQLYSQQVKATLLQPECLLAITLFSDRYPQLQIGGRMVSLYNSSLSNRGFKTVGFRPLQCSSGGRSKRSFLGYLFILELVFVSSSKQGD